MEIHYKIIGIILILLAFAHAAFPTYFKWEKELKHLSLINQQIMKVHTFFIALVVFLMGLLCIIATEELIHSDLGKIISLGFGVFWSIRLFVQFFGYAAELWKGKKMETIIHIGCSILWVYLTVVFGSVFFM